MKGFIGMAVLLLGAPEFADASAADHPKCSDRGEVTLCDLDLASSKTGGLEATLTVELNRVADREVAVALRSSDVAFPVPETLSVPRGRKFATIPIHTHTVPEARSVVVAATLGPVTREATIALTPSPALEDAGPQETPVLMTGQRGHGFVGLNGWAPEQGILIRLSSSDTRAARVPESIRVPDGEALADFEISVPDDASDKTVTITASDRYGSRSFSVEILAVKIVSLTLTPEAADGSVAIRGKVTLSRIPRLPVEVFLMASGPPPRVDMPLSVRISGSASADFEIKSELLDAVTSVTISASLADFDSRKVEGPPVRASFPAGAP